MTAIQQPHELLKRIGELEAKLIRAETIDTRSARRALNSGDVGTIRAAVVQLIQDVEIVTKHEYCTGVDWDRVNRVMEGRETEKYEPDWGVHRRVPVGGYHHARGECVTVDEFYELLGIECDENGCDGFEFEDGQYWVIRQCEAPDPGPYWEDD